VSVAALDDLQGPATCISDDLRHLWSLVAGIGEDTFDEWEQTPRRTKQIAGAVTILYIGRLNADVQQEAERVDQDMALAPGDFLARIEALRIKRRAPF